LALIPLALGFVTRLGPVAPFPAFNFFASPPVETDVLDNGRFTGPLGAEAGRGPLAGFGAGLPKPTEVSFCWMYRSRATVGVTPFDDEKLKSSITALRLVGVSFASRSFVRVGSSCHFCTKVAIIRNSGCAAEARLELGVVLLGDGLAEERSDAGFNGGLASPTGASGLMVDVGPGLAAAAAPAYVARLGTELRCSSGGNSISSMGGGSGAPDSLR